jgi:hypothetical protein
MRRPVTVIAKTARVVPVAGLPVTEMAAQAPAVPVVMTGPVMAVTVVMPEMMKAASEVMSEEVVTGKSTAKTMTAESPRHGVGLRQGKGEKNRGSDGNGFSQQH